MNVNPKRLYFPLRINLQEINEEPRSFVSDSASGELKVALKDLIEDQPYEVCFELQKAGNAYLLNGKMNTKMPLICSDCSETYLEPLELQFQEVLVIQPSFQKGDQSTKANHSHEWAEGQAQALYLESPYFDVAEFLHEQIALAEPFRPTGTVDPEHICEDLKAQVHREWLSFGKDSSVDLKSEANPFKALENLKLK